MRWAAHHGQMDSAQIIRQWPEESREAAQLVIDAHGEPHTADETRLIWYQVGEWKRIVATRDFWEHRFPAPHHDCVESFLDYRVPVTAVGPIAEFDGSVSVRRTAGEISAMCHDEEANRLALNLAHDIVTRERDAADARDYYAEEFLNARRGGPTPYMDRLTFAAGENTGDVDEQTIDEQQLRQAERSR